MTKKTKTTTADTTPDIAPRLVEGEPVCSGEECPHYAACEWDCFSYCPPGLRRQRDALQAERDAARRELCAAQGALLSGAHVNPAESYAASRGWAYLYEKETP